MLPRKREAVFEAVLSGECVFITRRIAHNTNPVWPKAKEEERRALVRVELVVLTSSARGCVSLHERKFVPRTWP